MAQSSIDWTEVTWNPVTGCDKVSAGCKFCYAEVMPRRLKAMNVDKYRNGFNITLHPESLQGALSMEEAPCGVCEFHERSVS